MGGGVMRNAAKIGIAGGAAAAAGLRGRRGPRGGGRRGAVGVLGGGRLGVRGLEGRGGSAEETAVGKPRLIFTPPSREEAEEATTELRDAIQRVSFSEAPVELVKNKLVADAITPAMPGHVVQAYTLLQSSPEARSAVASLVSDENVWDAVLKNKEVKEFCMTHQQTLVHTFPEDTDTVESPEKPEDASPENASRFSKAKKKVVEIVVSITHFFQDMFRNPEEDQAGTSSSNEKGSTHPFAAAGGPILTLAIAVILLILFKGKTLLGLIVL